MKSFAMYLPIILSLIGLEAISAPRTYTIEARTIQIITNRPDLKVEKILTNPICNKNIGTPEWQPCESLKINGDSELQPEFLSIGKNRVEIPHLTIEFSGNPGEVFCIGMKVFFEGIPNQTDSEIYVDMDDRYSILSFCSASEAPYVELPQRFQDAPRFGHKRMYTFAEYNRVLNGPFLLHLRPKPE